MNTFFETPITANGNYEFPPMAPARSFVIEIYGTFGGGTATIGYISPSGIFIAYKTALAGPNLTTTFEESWILESPGSGQFAILVAGATTPSLKFKVTIRP